jgi:hypothetical protein
VAAAPPEVVVEWEEADKVVVVEDLAVAVAKAVVVVEDLAVVVARAAVVVEDLAVVVAKAEVVAEDLAVVEAKAVVVRAVEVEEDLAAARVEVWAAAGGQVVEWVVAEAEDLAAVVVRVAEAAVVNTLSSKGRRFRAAPFF